MRLDNINCFYGTNQCLFDVSLNIEKGDVLVLLGPSGAGKSTLLRVFNLLEIPKAGAMHIDDQYFLFDLPVNQSAISHLRQKVGMVFQQYNLWPHMTVLENLVEAPIKVKKMPRELANAKAAELIKRLRLYDLESRYPLQLSGGQQQRVSIARALMMEPEVLLFDEPTAALDPAITTQLISIVKELSATGITQVVVTHEVELARKIATHVIYLEGGKIVEMGTADCLSSPTTEAFSHYLSH